MNVGKKFKFDAAHYLPGYKGRCKNLHGHTWVVEITVDAPVSAITGMVIDFNALTAMVEGVIEKFDHSLVNKVVPNPTCENLVNYFIDALRDSFSDLGIDDYQVEIQEGEGGFAWRWSDDEY